MSKNYNRSTRSKRSTSKQSKTGNAVDRKNKEQFDKTGLKTASKGNPMEDYNHNPTLVLGAGNLSFSWPLGNRIKLNNINNAYDPDTIGGWNTNAYLPGVCSLNFTPTFGLGLDHTSPINVAAQNFYSEIRHMNSGHANYDAPDLINYLLAIDSCYMYYAFMCRLYGLLLDYSQFNRYLPDTIIRAHGVDTKSLSSNMAAFKYYIDVFGTKLSTLNVPKTMGVFQRHMWMCSDIFIDTPNLKSQIYVFVPQGFYQYDSTTCTLQFNNFIALGYPKSLSDIITFGDNLLTNLLNIEDINIMSGDIYKAYGNEGVFKLSLITPDFKTTFNYNTEVLDQIRNSKVLGTNDSCFHDGSLNTDQMLDGYFYFDPKLTIPHKGFLFSDILSVYPDNPDPLYVIATTRFIPGVKSEKLNSAGTGFEIKFDSIGTELIHNIVIFTKPYDGTLSYNLLSRYVTNEDRTYYLSFFEAHPMVQLVKHTDTSDYDVQYYYPPNWDFDNYTVIGNVEIARMHETALLSLFNIPTR